MPLPLGIFSSFRHGLPDQSAGSGLALARRVPGRTARHESMDRDVARPMHLPWPWMPAFPAGMTAKLNGIGQRFLTPLSGARNRPASLNVGRLPVFKSSGGP